MTYLPSTFAPAGRLAYQGTESNVARLANSSHSFAFPAGTNTLGATGTGTTTLTLPKAGSYEVTAVAQIASDGTGGDSDGTLTLTQGGTAAPLTGFNGGSGSDAVTYHFQAGRSARAVLSGTIDSDGTTTLTFAANFTGQSMLSMQVSVVFRPTQAHPQ